MCMIELWRNEPRISQHIFQPIGFCENIYSDILIDLSLNYPQEMQEYIDNNTDSNQTIKKLCYLIYPILLNSYIHSHHIDRFERVLCKWGQIKGQKLEVADYISNSAMSNKDIIADYYSKLFNPFNHEIKIVDNIDIYIDSLQGLYYKDQEIFEFILNYADNRSSIYSSLVPIDDINSYPMDIMTIIADGPKSDNENCVFIKYMETALESEIGRHYRGSEAEKHNIEEHLLMKEVIKGLVENRKAEELPYFLDLIINDICNLDSIIYLNTGKKINFYSDFEKKALDDSLIKNKKELERYDKQHHSQDHKVVINILQKYLETLNYKNRRNVGRQDNEDPVEDWIFKKGHYEEGGLSLYVFSGDDEKTYEITKSINSTSSVEFDFENDAILLGNSCPQKIVIQMCENGFIKTVGRGYQIGGKGYPIALVNKEWLESIEVI